MSKASIVKNVNTAAFGAGAVAGGAAGVAVNRKLLPRRIAACKKKFKDDKVKMNKCITMQKRMAMKEGDEHLLTKEGGWKDSKLSDIAIPKYDKDIDVTTGGLYKYLKNDYTEKFLGAELEIDGAEANSIGSKLDTGERRKSTNVPVKEDDMDEFDFDALEGLTEEDIMEMSDDEIELLEEVLGEEDEDELSEADHHIFKRASINAEEEELEKSKKIDEHHEDDVTNVGGEDDLLGEDEDYFGDMPELYEEENILTKSANYYKDGELEGIDVPTGRVNIEDDEDSKEAGRQEYKSVKGALNSKSEGYEFEEGFTFEDDEDATLGGTQGWDNVDDALNANDAASGSLPKDKDCAKIAGEDQYNAVKDGLANKNKSENVNDVLLQGI